ncbi:cyclophane-containing peptide 2OG-Fe(II) oxygenase YhhC [Sphingomonas sp. PP-CC-3G-468]|uniref:cyclophane-containing peptide 2OG-Fe(II) oxygenase YhhC n=1 Tax=Sphingomonas sp. PP-CC-3G-468 TaxID=2135656 RepID=UPI0010453C7C|nr:cyclophane-containing peptide 2OG-Fe(II) oxygenase YhhC [Sphingomonas sp. PP-CC-3G-468]TCM07459.1 2-oxoglutarate-Fe(II)-dependent oxygenase superfamily protein [Sphingomonas sp. PP-CC-3G-468]
MTAAFIREVRHEPFPHATAMSALPSSQCEALLDWFEGDAPWRLRIASFYEQWEMHLDAVDMPSAVRSVVSDEVTANLSAGLLVPIGARLPHLTEVTAHKLLPGQTIRIHNDHLEDGETHRILLQLNRGWSDEQGGMLMLFGSAAASDVRRIVRPLHGSSFAFEISSRSYHAVSTIASGERYTLVYSFRDAERA